MTATESAPSRSFVRRRLHSLLGLWIVLFLIEHLLTNSQAALLIGQNGTGFIRSVNVLKHLPYLPVIEIVLLGVPILLHGVWGIRFLLTSKSNAYRRGKHTPHLPEYGRNHAYVWQRISSWILVVGLIAHVGYMRFHAYPVEVNLGKESYYSVRVGLDPGLYTVADRLGVELYDTDRIKRAEEDFRGAEKDLKSMEARVRAIRERGEAPLSYDSRDADLLKHYRELEDRKARLNGLTKRTLTEGQVIAEAPDFGTAMLLVVRNAFRSLFTAILYTIFVIAAVYHAFNGLWTFMITWGIVLKMRSQSKAVNRCIGIMIVIGLLGLAAIWGTYFVNLKV
ncbi:MAG: succinate dehydrogenase [Simkaniaceae bacterium]|nr:succinate dehydrogenase [Simkaniaceae bacterium]